jgi:Xaa-Pro aminopeptidase
VFSISGGSRPGTWSAVLFLASAVWAAPGSDPSASQFVARRAELRKALPNGAIVLFGRAEADSDDLRSGFFQEPNFYYLTGWNQPGAVMVIEPERDILFLPAKDPEAEKWTGVKASAQDANAAAITGFDHVKPSPTLEEELLRLLARYPRLYALKGTTGAAKLERLAPLRDISDARPAIARLRMKKSREEIALIERATEVSIEAHRASWKRAEPGLYEYQIAATMEAVFVDRGCERPAYAPIVGSGPNSVFLHYSRNRRRMDGGEVLLMDVAAECAGYTSDITRTIPVGRKFSKRQKEIYDVVLGAQKAAIAAIKPGMTIGKNTPNSIYKIAYDYIDTHGRDRRGETLGKYFTHGLSHHVGLEVHDASDTYAPLEAGMVITVEPGIYIPEEDLGVRIEDVVLVTEKGARVLSGALPRDAEEIEKAMKRSSQP